MVLELHSWGPAFSLPSIDAQCLATITYLSLTVPKDQWDLLATYDPKSNPTRSLPALRDNTKWIAGFNNIIDYLSKKSDQWSLDLSCKDSQSTADVTAFSSFIDSHGQSLIDLSLYVSSENYRTTTLPAYTCILPWPEQWLIPSQHRATAKSRTAHLNFSSLDLDDHNSAESNRKSILEMIPTSLRSSRESVSSLVNLPQHASRFRLEALADDWLGPLHELLGEKLYLLSDQRPTSLDCLAFAYLALAVVPVVPQPWLKDSVIARYPKLAAYVNQLVALAFGGPTRANRAIMQSPPPPPPRSADTASGFGSNRNEGARSEGVLPWREPQPRGTYLTAMALFDSVFGSLPIIGAHYRNGIIILAPVQNESPEKMMHAKTKNDSSLPRQTILPAVLTVVGTTAVAMTAYFFYGGLSTFLATEPGPRKHRFSDFGEAGALLAMADLGSSTTRMSEVRDSGRRLGSGLAPVAEVAVGVDGVEEL